MTLKRTGGLTLALALLGAACSGSGTLTVAERPAQTGEILEAFDFGTPGSFEEGDYDLASLHIVDGEYRIEASQGIIWGQSGGQYTDMAVEAQARAESNTSDARYGVMCRADPSNDGDGYLFAVSPDGRYYIMRGEGDHYNVLQEGATPAGLVTDGVNTLHAVCVGSYLALYVNQTFVAAVNDSMYTSGLPALAAGAGGGGTTVAFFDDLVVFDVALAE